MVLALLFIPVRAAAEVAELRSQSAAANQRVQTNQAQAAKLAGEASTLEGQIALMNIEIALIQSQIGTAQAKLATINQELAVVEARMDAKRAVLAEYLRSSYMVSQTSEVEMLFGSGSLGQFVDRQKYLQSGQDRVNEVLEEIGLIKQDLDGKRAAVVSIKNSLKAKQDEINVRRAAQNQLLAKTRGEQDRYETYVAEAKAQRDAANARLQQLAGSGSMRSQGYVEAGQIIGYEGNTGNSFGTHLHFEVRVGGQPTNPSSYINSGRLQRPIYGVLTQGYGVSSCGYCGYSVHTGLDISSGGVAPVRAAAAGNIIVNEFIGDGYGHKIIIDHGNGLWTLYAHMR